MCVVGVATPKKTTLIGCTGIIAKYHLAQMLHHFTFMALPQIFPLTPVAWLPAFLTAS